MTIEDLSNGKCAVKNDGTKEQLQAVLKAAFPEDKDNPCSSDWEYCKYFYRLSDELTGEWYGRMVNEYGLPVVSVKDLYNQLPPERGERVEVSDYKDFSEKRERIFLTKIEGVASPFFSVRLGHEERFANGEEFDYITWKYMRRIPQKPEIEVTVKVNGKEVEPSKISKETWEGLRDEKE